jgi:hypothetical protein
MSAKITTMKKRILLFSFILFTTFVSAQQGRFRPGGGGGGRQMREKVDAMKIGYLTDYLDLTPDEAKSFWPVYNKYQDELDQLRKTRKNNFLNEQMNFDSMSDADLEKMVDGEIAFHQSELDLQKKYHPQFKKILPIRKVAKLYRAEEEFKKRLLEMIREKRKEERRQMKQ